MKLNFLIYFILRNNIINMRNLRSESNVATDIRHNYRDYFCFTIRRKFFTFISKLGFLQTKRGLSDLNILNLLSSEKINNPRKHYLHLCICKFQTLSLIPFLINDTHLPTNSTICLYHIPSLCNINHICVSKSFGLIVTT
ncbi:hypothetical protein V1478_012818 [Vespula squamosa]|uniref:Uncharacterized protein n=1 Tax=Vespula squamosa TaxID=30214 RepID=A0ABD2A914_VESSQ